MDARTNPEAASAALADGGSERHHSKGLTIRYEAIGIALDWDAGGVLRVIRVDAQSPIVVALHGVALRGRPAAIARRLDRSRILVLRDRDDPATYSIDQAGITMRTDLRGRVDLVLVELRPDAGS